MSRKHFKTPKEIIEAKASELGISLEQLMELDGVYKAFTDKVELDNKNRLNKFKEGGSHGGKSVSSKKQSIKAKKAAKTNLERGNIDKFIKAGNKKVRELVESGEWSEISSKGGHATAANWDGQKDHMRCISEEGRKASAISRKLKAESKNQKKLNELSILLEFDKWYTAEEITELYPDFQNNSGTKTFRRFALRNNNFFEIDYKSHQTKRYKLK